MCMQGPWQCRRGLLCGAQCIEQAVLRHLFFGRTILTSLPMQYMRTCSAAFDADTVRQRLRELAFLNSAASIHFRVVDPATSSGPPTNGALPAASANGASARVRVEPEGAAEPNLAPQGSGWEVLACPGGLRDYVAFLNKDRQPMHAPIFLSKEVRRTSNWLLPCSCSTRIAVRHTCKLAALFCCIMCPYSCSITDCQ